MFEVVERNWSAYTHELDGRPDSADPLDSSVEKWECIVDFLRANPWATVFDNGRRTCALCILYWAGDCNDCPIKAHTGHAFCFNTPHDAYKDEPTLANAKAELRFLEALRENPEYMEVQ